MKTESETRIDPLPGPVPGLGRLLVQGPEVMRRRRESYFWSEVLVKRKSNGSSFSKCAVVVVIIC